MKRSLTGIVLLLSVLIAGCATVGVADEDELVQRVRAELALHPQLNSSQVTVTNRDGVVNIGGFVSLVTEANAIRDVVEGVEGVDRIENTIVVQGE